MRNLGLHIVDNAVDDQVRRALGTGCPSTAFFVNPDIGTVEAVLSASSGQQVTLCGRIVRPFTVAEMSREAAIAFADDVVRKSDSLDRHIKIWQAANEVASGAARHRHQVMPVSHNADEIVRVASFDAAFAAHLKKHGLHALGTAWSTGTPYTGEDGLSTQYWAHYWPVLSPDLWLNVHEYWHLNGVSEPWHIGRLKHVWDQWPSALKDDPVMVSELGWEVVPGVEGWRPPGGDSSVSISKYLEGLSNYSKMMPPNWAASIFAIAHGDSRWGSYDIKPLLPYLAEMWQASPVHVWPAEESKGMKTVNLVGKLETHPNLRFNRRDLFSIDTYVIHHFGFNSQPPYEAAVKRVAYDHVHTVNSKKSQWPGIAYHRVIAPDGTIYLTNELESVSWHAGSRRYNDRGIGIALMCACHQRAPTDAQVASLKEVVKRLDNVPDIPGMPTIRSHREVRETGYTECPGDSVIALFPTLRDVVQPPPPPTDDEYQRGYAEGQHHERQRVIGIFERAYGQIVGADQQAMEAALNAIDDTLDKVPDHGSLTGTHNTDDEKMQAWIEAGYLPQEHKDRDLT